MNREPKLTKEVIAHLSDEIEQLIQEVKSSDIDEAARNYMLHHLLRISQALREYEVFGPEQIREEVSLAIGSVYFNPTEAQKSFQKYRDLIIEVGSVVQSAAAVWYLTSEVLKLLSGP